MNTSEQRDSYEFSVMEALDDIEHYLNLESVVVYTQEQEDHFLRMGEDI